MESEVQVSISVLNSAWGSDDNITTLMQTWDQTSLLKRMNAAEFQSVMVVINEWLKSPSKRANGLTLLNKVVAQASNSILSENIATWIQQATKFLEKNNDEESRYKALMILRSIVKKSPEFPGISKPITSSVIPMVAECLKDSNDNIKCQALACLETCMKSYGGSCGTHKLVIEQCVIEVATKGDPRLVPMAAVVVAWLPLVGGGGAAQQGHQAAWKQLQQRLLGSLHAELDLIFEGVSELPLNGSQMELVLPLPPLTETRPTASLQQLQRRASSLCIYLSALLTEPMSLVKPVLVVDILDLVCRGLAVTPTSLGNAPTLEKRALRTLLPSLHCSLLELLKALVSSVGKKMLLYHPIISRLIINTLKWTRQEKQDPGAAKPYRLLRAAAYESLLVWLQVSSAKSGVDFAADELVPLVVLDITPEKDNVTLQTPTKSLKRKSRKHVTNSSGEKKGGEKTTGSSDSALCESALEALTAIFESVGSLLKPEHHKSLQQLVVVAAFELQRGREVHPLYERPTCRVHLLELLQALVLHPHPLCASPVTHALTIFKAGQHSPCREVSIYCKKALHVLERMAQPPQHTLGYPVQDSYKSPFWSGNPEQQLSDSDMDGESEHVLSALSSPTEDPPTPVLNSTSKIAPTLQRQFISQMGLEPAIPETTGRQNGDGTSPTLSDKTVRLTPNTLAQIRRKEIARLKKAGQLVKPQMRVIDKPSKVQPLQEKKDTVPLQTKTRSSSAPAKPVPSQPTVNGTASMAPPPPSDAEATSKVPSDCPVAMSTWSDKNKTVPTQQQPSSQTDDVSSMLSDFVE